MKAGPLAAAADTASVGASTSTLLRIGVRSKAAALALGAMTPLAFAPLYLLPAFLLGFGGLFLLLERTRSVQGAFLFGWLFGIGNFTVGLGWITEAFAVDAETFGALALPALVALSAGLALFPALSLAAARYLAGPGRGPRLLIAFTICWTTGEWLRGTVLTGFPWNLAGHAWGFADAPLQLAAFIGIHGLSLATILLAALPAFALSARRVWPFGLAACCVALLWASGAARLAVPPPPDLPDVRLRLVQPEVAQSLKWAPSERARILADLLALSRTPGALGAEPTHLLWPETAVPYLIAEEPAVRAAIAAVVPPRGALVTGGVRRGLDVAGQPSMRNSVLVLDGTARILSAYDKMRLVPFGEYVPFRAWLPGVPKLTNGAVDFSPGTDAAPLPVHGLPAAMTLICYEAIFPGGGGGTARDAGWILTLTNDAWFGRSWGPHQHALAAKMRAVELGLPMVRVANGGVSFVTDAYGRMRQQMALGTRGVMDVALPGALPSRTPYASFGDWPLLAVLFTGLAGLAATRRGDEPHDA
ncbi:apolipoprotein N-acyltransferase [Falsiroseomonas tokyonensis]|uniref:Apolipoprotein N-acyltransferase n=1 Tax=Falsiroseomonas tokyonensis TaxID=430521 RepID=A0ABV7C2C2_9PROT|nr:apolipoprotein N-acyltransferase [Falsiroseomonas tokyonensis]MBU8542010.1 apolipoprotein N-acyltransferase [Falsiroseomonas tokyonensis]